MALKNKHILSTRDFSLEEINEVLDMADKYYDTAKNKGKLDVCKGKILASLFYEPSTRTRFSFETAMYRLGGDVLTVTDIGASSIGLKGETVSDTGRVVSKFADIAAIRHASEGSARELASNSEIPVINAGDGSADHPSQGLLDLYTIKRELGKLDGITVAFAGDLKYGRTANSLAYLLAHYDINFRFISPPELKMKEEVIEFLKEKGKTYKEYENLEEGMADADVIYMARVQKERFTDKSEYERLKDSFVLSKGLIEHVNPKVKVMHALPRINEISLDVDELEGAAYFRQVENGVATRMALITLLLGLWKSY